VTVLVSGAGATATAGSAIENTVYLPNGTRGTADQRFVSEALEDLFGSPPTMVQLKKLHHKPKANHGRFVTDMLQASSFQTRFLHNEAAVLFTAVTENTPTRGRVRQAAHELQGRKSLEWVGRKWCGASPAVVDQVLVQGLTKQLFGRPATAEDLARDMHFLKHGRKVDALVAALIGSAEYNALASA
jgi:hypothetical protein